MTSEHLESLSEGRQRQYERQLDEELDAINASKVQRVIAHAILRNTKGGLKHAIQTVEGWRRNELC